MKGEMRIICLSAVSKIFSSSELSSFPVKNLGISIGRFKNLVIKRCLDSIILSGDLTRFCEFRRILKLKCLPDRPIEFYFPAFYILYSMQYTVTKSAPG